MAVGCPLSGQSPGAGIDQIDAVSRTGMLPGLRQTRLYQMLAMVVEPIIDPFRRLLYRIPGMDQFPLDLSFMAAWLTLSMLAGLL